MFVAFTICNEMVNEANILSFPPVLVNLSKWIYDKHEMYQDNKRMETKHFCFRTIRKRKLRQHSISETKKK